MQFSDYIIYADESGDPGLRQIDEQFPVMSLAMCVFPKDAYAASVVPTFQKFKFSQFGHDAVVLHEREIRKQIPPFAFLTSEQRRSRFIEALSEVVRNADFTAIAVVLDKLALREATIDPAHPYELALALGVERCDALLRERGESTSRTHVVLEQRSDSHQIDVTRGLATIFDDVRALDIADCFELVIADKRINSTGLQIADLIARPIARHVISPDQPNRAYDIIRRKLWHDEMGNAVSMGLSIFPKQTEGLGPTEA